MSKTGVKIEVTQWEYTLTASFEILRILKFLETFQV